MKWNVEFNANGEGRVIRNSESMDNNIYDITHNFDSGFRVIASFDNRDDAEKFCGYFKTVLEYFEEQRKNNDCR